MTTLPQPSDNPRTAAVRRTRRPPRTRALALAITALFLLASALAAAACSDDSPDKIAVRGRSIEIHAERPVITEKVSYAAGGEHRVIRPSASNRELAAVHVTVVNRTSTVMPMLLDPEAARLGDRRGDRIPALDPFERYGVADSASEDEDRFVPLLWGEIDLDRNYQVSGWMLFDVPKGLTLGTFWWDEIDEVIGDYVEYTRR